MKVLKDIEYNRVKIQIVLGDITDERVDAIVNAANRFLRHGGGVAGAIVRAGGAVIQRESDALIRKKGPLKTGDAVYTSAGALNAKYIIHVVGPVWRGLGNEDELLYQAVYNGLVQAKQLGVSSISMPAISTGVYGFPVDRAVPIFARAIKDFIGSEKSSISLIRLCNISKEITEVFVEKFEI